MLQPKVVEGLLGKEVVQISCGTSHSAALTLHGEVYTWGAGDGGRVCSAYCVHDSNYCF